MPSKRTPEEMREYQRTRRAQQRARDVVEEAPKAPDRVIELEDEVKRLKRELAEAKSHPDPVVSIAAQAKVASRAKRAQKILNDFNANEDYRAIIQNLTQDQRDAILARMPKTKRAGEK